MYTVKKIISQFEHILTTPYDISTATVNNTLISKIEVEVKQFIHQHK